jgi:hypothetical protein
MSELPFKAAFDVFDVVRGVAASIFDESGAEIGTNCMEDGDELEIVISKVYSLIENFDIKVLITEALKLVSDVGEIYNDCKELPSQFSLVGKAFSRMANAFTSDSKTALMKLVMAVVGEGTNLMAQVNDIIADIAAEKFFEAGDEIGRIVAILTIKLY